MCVLVLIETHTAVVGPEADRRLRDAVRPQLQRVMAFYEAFSRGDADLAARLTSDRAGVVFIGTTRTSGSRTSPGSASRPKPGQG